MGQRGTAIESWVERLLQAEPPRSKSLIMTVFGDSIAPFTGHVWLGGLIRLMEPFGINERLVRTSGFRLVEEGWLATQREGRRSRYVLTASGAQRLLHASQKIYSPAAASWNGRWTLLVQRGSGCPVERRTQLRRELEWEGFGVLAPGVFLHPGVAETAAMEVLKRLQMNRGAALLEAKAFETGRRTSSRALAEDCWRLDEVRERFEAFVERFREAEALLSGSLEPRTAFLLQTMLIHSFRRAVLHDPRLPGPLLPRRWPGHTAYRLCLGMYRKTHVAAQQFVVPYVEEPPARRQISQAYLDRFGGLRRPGGEGE